MAFPYSFLSLGMLIYILLYACPTYEEFSLPEKVVVVQGYLEVDPALGLDPGHDAGGDILVDHHPLRVLRVKSGKCFFFFQIYQSKF